MNLTNCASLKTAINVTSNEADRYPVFCEIFVPINWSSADTEETLRQVLAHNAVWDGLCTLGS